jgi:hypothetical protein
MQEWGTALVLHSSTNLLILEKKSAMKFHTRQSRLRAARALLVPVAGLAFAAAANAQTSQVVLFSVDWQSDTVALPDSFTLAPITEGDILAPQTLVPQIGPLPTPGIVETGGTANPWGLGLATHGGCVGHLPSTPCGIEVDAISHGMDRIELLTTPGTPNHGDYAFSVNRWSYGGFWLSSPPNVMTEAPCNDDIADVFRTLGLPSGPLPPFSGQHTGFVDGNGLVNCGGTGLYPGLGLFENPFGTPLHDNLDALDMDVPDKAFARTTATYFSLDGAIVDPITLIPGSNSAAANGFRPGDVLLTLPLGTPTVYASANQLGLDLPPLLPGSDDLDALALWENGVAGYQRSSVPYDWTTGAADMLLFSVRRGSAVIGQPDAFFGLPIEPGDILTPTGPVGSLPGIWIAAEALGLNTMRSSSPVLGSDDVDALDTVFERPPGMNFCAGDGTGNACPCGNFGTTGRGCGNSSNAAGAVLWSNGFASVSNDSVVLHASGMTPTPPLQFFQGTAPIPGGLPFVDGLFCVGGAITRFPVKFALNGNCSFGYGIPGDPLVSVAGGALPAQTLYYQVIYRDVPVFCTPATQNFTNGYKITWTP